jgi:hypothetical protein
MGAGHIVHDRGRLSTDRRGLLLTAIGAGLGLGTFGLTGALAATGTLAATDDELAYASFGHATELLLQDFYARAAGARLFAGDGGRELRRARFNAEEHAAALATLLAGAGQQPAVQEDFEFAWPEGTFASRPAASAAGLLITETLGGVYVAAATAVSISSYRRLYASMAANVGRQAGFLSQQTGARAVGISFPAAVEVEAASDAIEAFLG